MAKTLTQLLATLRNELLIEPTEDKWSDTLLTSFLNRAQTRVAREMECEFTRDATTDSVDGTQEYTLPNGFLRLLDTKKSVVYVDSASRENYPTYTTVDNLISMYGEDYRSTATADKATPTYFYIRENNKIGFYPVPNYSGTNNVYLYYFGEPTTISSTVNCQLPDTCEMAICYYAEKLAWDNINKPLNQTITETSRMAMMNYNEEILSLATSGDFSEPSKMDYLECGNV